MNNGFKYFSKKLLPNPTKLLNIVAKVFGMSKPTEIFISVKDGLWGNVDTWTTVSGRVGRIPTANDDVYIKTNVGHGPLDAQYSCRNLSVASNAKLSEGPGGGNKSYLVFGDFKCWGSLESGGSGFALWLRGYNNYILPNPANPSNFTKGFQYVAPVGGDVQNIMPDSMVPYNSGMGIVCSGGSKQLIGNTSATSFTHGNANVFFELNSFDLSCSTTFTSYANVTSLGNGNLFVNGVASFFGGVNFYNSNRTVELRGGIGAFSTTPSTGLGKWSFTTNNQTVILTNNITVNFTGPIEIGAGLTITNNFVSNTAIFQISGTLDLLSAGSSFINKGVVYWNNPAFYNVTTGTFDQTTFANTVGYVFNGNATLPYTAYSSLTISGTGTKTQASGTNTISGALTINAGARLDSGGNTIVSGASNINNAGQLNLLTYDWTFAALTQTTSILTKTGAGSIIFTGLWTLQDAAASTVTLSGNPTVELRAGFNFYGSSIALFNTGTGLWSFTTNNQNLSFGYSVFNFNCPLLVSGAITVTLATGPGSGIMLLSNYLDGNNASSTFNLNSRLYLNYAAQPIPMSTSGVFNPTNASTSVLGHVFDGDYTLPYTTYNGLVVGGTGTKTLLGNTNITSFSSFSPSGFVNSIFELSTFDFTNSGVTNITIARLLMRKSGSGSILFGGLVNMIAAANFGGFDFSGNPNVEFRNGFTNGYAGVVSFNLGSGPISFTTNNQSFIHGYRPTTINGTMTVGNDITLTIDNGSSGGTTFIINGVVNGSNATSTLKMGVNSITAYNNTTQPMATGVLDTSTNANTWIYGLNNQDIKGSPTISPKQVYRNLTLNGTGTKTLQGYVSVLNTYTLTAPATLANNGFTLTNP
jgi:hypothetical protein